MDPKQPEQKQKIDKILDFIQTQLTQGKSPKEIYQYLVQKGLPEKNAREFVQQVLDQHKQVPEPVPPAEPALGLQTGLGQRQAIFNYVDQQLTQGTSQGDIVDTLESKGMPRDKAIDLVLNTAEYQMNELMAETYVPPAADSSQGPKKIVIGIIALAGGAIFTLASYNSADPGGTYYLLYGPMAYGAFSMISGFIDLFR